MKNSTNSDFSTALGRQSGLIGAMDPEDRVMARSGLNLVLAFLPKVGIELDRAAFVRAERLEAARHVRPIAQAVVIPPSPKIIARRRERAERARREAESPKRVTFFEPARV